MHRFTYLRQRELRLCSFLSCFSEDMAYRAHLIKCSNWSLTYTITYLQLKKYKQLVGKYEFYKHLSNSFREKNIFYATEKDANILRVTKTNGT